MAISTADFKNGMCIEFNGKLCTIVEFQHVKPGKGSAFVRTKLRDIKTGRIIDNTFNAGVRLNRASGRRSCSTSTTTVPISTSWTTTRSSRWPSRPKPWARPRSGSRRTTRRRCCTLATS
ncbi:MAG: hypothetical protein ACLTMP_04825 [Eggerthella lenta]